MSKHVAGWVRLFALVALIAAQAVVGAAYLLERGPGCTTGCCTAEEGPSPCGCSLASSPCQCSFVPAPNYSESADQATFSKPSHVVDAVLPVIRFGEAPILWPEPSCFWPESRGPPSDTPHPLFAPRAPPVMA